MSHAFPQRPCTRRPLDEHGGSALGRVERAAVTADQLAGLAETAARRHVGHRVDRRVVAAELRRLADGLGSLPVLLDGAAHPVAVGPPTRPPWPRPPGLATDPLERVLASLAAAPAVDDDQDWQEQALCAQTDPGAFFPEKGGSTREAKRICSGCPVRAECLEYALAHDERFGVWGGLSERERRRLRRDLDDGGATRNTSGRDPARPPIPARSPRTPA